MIICTLKFIGHLYYICVSNSYDQCIRLEEPMKGVQNKEQQSE